MNRSKPILTAKVGTNADLFPDVAALYIPARSWILDTTWGKGVFWKKVTWLHEYTLYRNDKNRRKGDYHYDFRHFPDDWACRFDVVVHDPPYLYVGGFKTLNPRLLKNYDNQDRAMKDKIHGVEAVDREMYWIPMIEAWRVLKPGGILIIKCMDQVQSGRNRLTHVVYSLYAEIIGYEIQDLFVMTQVQRPLMRHPLEQQKHARKNHSYFLILKKVPDMRLRHFP